MDLSSEPDYGMTSAILPPWICLDPLLSDWLREDIGRGDRSTSALLLSPHHRSQAQWLLKESGVIAGLPLVARVFTLLDPHSQVSFECTEGQFCQEKSILLQLEASTEALLMGERLALNLVMRLSGIATATRHYVEKIADLGAQLVDTRKTTPGLRILEKYASQVGGARNHRLGLDDALMLKDNHIKAAGGIISALAAVRDRVPYPLTVEVETSNLEEVRAALAGGADIIMLDNMSLEAMTEAVKMIRDFNPRLPIEASGNITLERIRAIAATGVDFISTSAPVTRSSWLDISMNLDLDMLV
jgi:nicotinate-nucleotide pyrophosphorylase (carboxylating)